MTITTDWNPNIVRWIISVSSFVPHQEFYSFDSSLSSSDSEDEGIGKKDKKKKKLKKKRKKKVCVLKPLSSLLTGQNSLLNVFIIIMSMKSSNENQSEITSRPKSQLILLLLEGVALI